MEYTYLRLNNPRLFWDGICRGKIPYSEGEALQTGTNVTNPLVEGIVGGPIPPEYSSFNPSTPPIGPGTGYPKPWRSYSQNAQNGSYGSAIGPYARLVKLPEADTFDLKDTCVGGQPSGCGESDGGIYGRIGIGNGQRLGFRAQDWYNQNEGSYGTTYYNTRTPIPDPQWLTWKQWWDSASKTTIPAIWVINNYTSFNVDVEVAYDVPDIGDAAYYPGPSLALYDDTSFNLLIAMIGIAAVNRWIL